MSLLDWAIKYNIPVDAYNALVNFYVIPRTDPDAIRGDNESMVQTRIRLEASRKGGRLFRNNVGAGYVDGNYVRWGLCNESAGMNKALKSSDLIGIKPVLITEAMVGYTVGQFLAREVKRGDWRYTGTPREVAQLKFIELVVSLGGDAQFANGEGTIT